MPTDPNLKEAIKQAMKEYEESYAWPPDIHFNRHRVPPAGWEYIGPDDHLQVTVFTTVATSGLTLALRTLDAKGQVHYQVENVDTSTLSTVVTSRFKMAEGWLIGAVVSNIGGGLLDQKCFVVLALQRTFKSGTAPHTILQQGYVTNVISVSWPPVFARGPAPSITPSGIVQIAQTVLAAPAASVTFSSIPQTFTGLLLSLMGRCSDAATLVNVNIQMNGDTGANYDSEGVQGIGASPSAFAASATSSLGVGNFTASTASANVPGVVNVWLPYYAASTFFKMALCQDGKFATLGTVTDYVSRVISGQWRNVSPITQLTAIDTGGGNFVAGSSFTLYGLT